MDASLHACVYVHILLFSIFMDSHMLHVRGKPVTLCLVDLPKTVRQHLFSAVESLQPLTPRSMRNEHRSRGAEHLPKERLSGLVGCWYHGCRGGWR